MALSTLEVSRLQYHLQCHKEATSRLVRGRGCWESVQAEERRKWEETESL